MSNRQAIAHHSGSVRRSSCCIIVAKKVECFLLYRPQPYSCSQDRLPCGRLSTQKLMHRICKPRNDAWGGTYICAYIQGHVNACVSALACMHGGALTNCRHAHRCMRRAQMASMATRRDHSRYARGLVGITSPKITDVDMHGWQPSSHVHLRSPP